MWLENRISYTEPFKADTAQKLYDMKNGKCSLCVIDESGGDHPPVNVPSFEHFKSTPFDELWEMVTTPKYKMASLKYDPLHARIPRRKIQTAGGYNILPLYVIPHPPAVAFN